MAHREPLHADGTPGRTHNYFWNYFTGVGRGYINHIALGVMLMEKETIDPYGNGMWTIKVDGTRNYQFTMINPMLMALKAIIESKNTTLVQITRQS